MATIITSVHYATFTDAQKTAIDRLSRQLNRALTLEDVTEILNFETRVTAVESENVSDDSRLDEAESQDQISDATDSDLKDISNFLLNLADENRSQETKEFINFILNKLEEQDEKINMIGSMQNSLDNLRSACLAMAARVDATATPATTFVSEFNALT